MIKVRLEVVSPNQLLYQVLEQDEDQVCNNVLSWTSQTTKLHIKSVEHPAIWSDNIYIRGWDRTSDQRCSLVGTDDPEKLKKDILLTLKEWAEGGGFHRKAPKNYSSEGDIFEF